MKFKVGYRPRPAQEQFHRSTKRFKLYSGAFRAGKTLAGSHEGIRLSMMPGNVGLIGRLDYPDLRDTTQKTFFEVLEQYSQSYGDDVGDPTFGHSEGIPGYRKLENIFKFRKDLGGSQILFRQLKDPNDYKSLSLGWFWLDEGTEVSEEMFLMLSSRLSLNMPYVGGFITTNPDTPHHWIHKRFYDEPLTQFEVVETSTYDNRENLPPGYIESLEELYDDDYRNRFLGGKWGLMKGLIYANFSRQIHQIKPFPIPPDWQKIRAIDFGYTNPFCCLWIARDGDGRLYVYREHYQANTLIETHAKIMHEATGAERISGNPGDPSAGQERRELANYGIPVTPADNAVNLGIQKVKSRLQVKGDGRPQLFIFDNCVHLLKEMETYKWRVTKGQTTEEPLKENDHAVDALRYGVSFFDRGSPKVVLGKTRSLV